MLAVVVVTHRDSINGGTQAFLKGIILSLLLSSNIIRNVLAFVSFWIDLYGGHIEFFHEGLVYDFGSKFQIP